MPATRSRTSSAEVATEVKESPKKELKSAETQKEVEKK